LFEEKIMHRHNDSSQDANGEESQDDFGPAFMPPFEEAKTILASMTSEEKAKVYDLLQEISMWFEGAVLWGIALAKLADVCNETGRNDKAAFFMKFAWALSKYPIFAWNAAVLSLETEDLSDVRALLQAYLDEYPRVLFSPTFARINPELTLDKLEHFANSARRLVAACSYAKADEEQDLPAGLVLNDSTNSNKDDLSTHKFAKWSKGTNLAVLWNGPSLQKPNPSPQPQPEGESQPKP
jgi:hypothetical protein